MTTPCQPITNDRCSLPGDKLIAIEMIGLPGAGKSTLIKPLLAALQSHGRASSGFLSLSRCLSGDRSLANYLRCQEAAITDARSRGDRFCVFQEGSLHEVWRLYYRGDPVDPALLNRAAHLPDFVVYLMADCRKTKERIRSKARLGPINRQLMNAPIPGDEWNRAANAMVSILEAIPPDRLLMIGNNADLAGAGLDEKAKQIASRIGRELMMDPPR